MKTAMTKKRMRMGLVCVAVLCLGLFVTGVMAQDAPADGTATEAATEGGGGDADSTSFWRVVTGSGAFGFILWMGLFGSLAASIYFVVDCSITVRAAKIMPQALITKVTESMEQGDVLKALKNCEEEPGPMANILTAGFSHVEEGFEVIQECVGVAADFESEKLMQRISYLSVVGSLAPMLGLLGTVQGMILAFANLAVMGAAGTSVLAINISQALYTTAAGLVVAIPSVACYNMFRNKANKIILRMEAITLDLIKDLRNVEVVADDGGMQ